MFDYVTTVILAALILVFGFLTGRALRAQRRALKWAGTVAAGILTLVTGVLLAAVLFGYWQLNRDYDNPVPEISIAMTPERVARGERFREVCAGCHAPDGIEALVGRDFLSDEEAPPIGRFFAPNLTPTHLADWSDGEIVRAIREGVHRSGRSLLIMPSQALHNVSDEDVYSIIAYLRSMPPAGEETPPNRLNALGAVMSMFIDIQTVQPAITEPVPSPQPGPTAAYGSYVSSFTCTVCHGADLLGDPEFPSPPLVTIALAWSEQEFIDFIRTGRRPDGTSVDESLMPWPALDWLLEEDDEVRGVYAYLTEMSADYSR